MSSVSFHPSAGCQIIEQEVPSPSRSQVLLKLVCASLNANDIDLYNDTVSGRIKTNTSITPCHEACATVVSYGDLVEGFDVGELVAINPCRPCWHCKYCLNDQTHLCLDTITTNQELAYAKHGMLSEYFVVEDYQCYPVGPECDTHLLSLCAALAGALHRTNRAGPLLGKRVLVSGSNANGLLTALAATLEAAEKVYYLADSEHTILTAMQLGITNIVDTRLSDTHKQEILSDIDIAIETSGSTHLLHDCLYYVSRGGRVVYSSGKQDNVSISLLYLIAQKELELRGATQFDGEFAKAVDLIARQEVNLLPLITTSVPFEESISAFELASSKRPTIKVLISARNE
ncbi:alcohol dehydrogenase catalytic domain-containing protein [Polycladidibacter stylochi]|uniref:alcohol dehydrogenase catalytic domain-containing protein n=1 Tax=Polycladidibacter stylochi TaxID=1807766 RepID=UPI001FCA8F01|nr:alcohol dehydrogenase catalytic domain-containing protein [Pseudovibrio stylochi]